MKRFSRLLVVCLISALGVWASYQYLRPHNASKSQNSTAPPIVQVISFTSDVRKKELQSQIWNKIDFKDTLREGDLIRTSTNSSAELLVLENKSKIFLQPNSMLKISTLKNSIDLSVLQGGLSLSTRKIKNQKINLVTKGKKFSVENNTKASIQLNKQGDAYLQVNQGGVNSKNMKINNQELAFLRKNKVSKQNIFFRDLLPADGSTIYVKKRDEKISFKWKPSKKRYDVELYLGTNPNSLSRANIESVGTQIGVVKYSLRPGTYYWQLRAIQDNLKSEKILSNYQKITILEKSPPRLIGPVKDDLISIKEKNITFRWLTPIKLKNKKLLLADSKDFSSPLEVIPIQETNKYQLAMLKKIGKYYWKISGDTYDGQETLISNMASFVIQRGIILAPPKLLSPIDNDTFFKSKNKSLEFNWQKVENADFYQLIVKKDSKQIFSKKINTNTHKMKFNKTGDYSWSVQALSKNNESKSPIMSRSFTILAPIQISWITKKTTYTYYDEIAPILLKWRGHNNQELTYRVRISTSPDFKKIEEHEVPNTKFTFQATKPTLYYIKIAALDKRNAIISKTKVLRINFIKKKLSAPKIRKVIIR